MRQYWPVAALLITVALYSQAVPAMWSQREQVRSDVPAGYIIPSRFSRVLAIGHQGLLSDYLFLKTATFIGGRSFAGQPMSEMDWEYVIRSLDLITDLDPYFTDPYFLAEGLLAWDASKPEEANRLLKKGIAHRTWDWRLQFFVGFNYFYFLQDYASASEYIMASADMPGSPAYLKTLGARLAYYGGKSRTALLFLEQMLEDASDPMLQQRLKKRLLALQRAVAIEDALELFKERQGRVPEFVELVDFGYLEELPADPYGGEWVLLPNGRVFSTSRFADTPGRNY